MAIHLRRLIFGIAPDEATFDKRGFHSPDDRVRIHLETVGGAFLRGYNLALEESHGTALVSRLDETGLLLRGFAFEGAAMALAILDGVTPWNGNRLQTFVEGPASPHLYMVYVGAGWALARLRGNVDRAVRKFDPLLRWLVVDGYGFHEGYFKPTKTIQCQKRPYQLTGYAGRAFDQGLGRSLWFVRGADVGCIAKTIAEFHPTRHSDLWSGVGLACAYAGGVGVDEVRLLRKEAGPYRDYLAQGACFAAKARQRASNPATHTEMACQVLCELPAEAAAEITQIALENLPPDGAFPAYEAWRQRIGVLWAKEVLTS